MKALFSPVLAVYSEPRERIYRALLAEPGRAWRVGQLAQQVPDVSMEAVRTTLYLLLGDRLVEPVPHQRCLMLRLNEEGRTTVEQVTAAWVRSGQSVGEDL